MDDLLELIMDAGEIRKKYGLKGCVLIVVGIVTFFGGLFGMIYWLA